MVLSQVLQSFDTTATTGKMKQSNHNIFLIISRVLVLCALRTVSAGRAPDTSPVLPPDWCSEHQGTLTTTTAECMCRYSCEGKGCQTGQGMVWYAYKNCPTGCRCLPKEAPLVQSTEEVFGKDEQTIEPVQCSETKASDCDEAKTNEDSSYSPAVSVPLNAMSEYEYDSSDDDYDDYYGGEHLSEHTDPEMPSEEPLSLIDIFLDWLDENYRLLFGGFVILLLSCTLIPTLLVVGSGEKDIKLRSKNSTTVPKLTSTMPKNQNQNQMKSQLILS